ncbi:MAG: glutathione S-transferase family protein [Gammaproteobacteria bacterium]|nr:glutathione S-transferase family protein [Gammaproteobacteria bacterium]
MTYKLLGANVSPFVRKCRAYMAEKGIAYDYEQVSPFAPPEGYKKISPLGKIPAFLDGDKALADSTAICIYLERCNPQPALYPGDHYQYARALWFEEYIDSGLIPIAGPQVFRPLVLAPMMSQQPVTKEGKAEVLKVVETAIHPMWEYLESELASNQFYVGNVLSIADLTVASGHISLRHAGVEPDAKRWPKLAAFLQRMYARPSFAALLAEESERWDKRQALAKI